MIKLWNGTFALLMVCSLALSQVNAQEAGEAGTGADAVDPMADPIGTPDAAGGEDASGFDPGWIGLAGLLGLAGLMGRDRDRRHDHAATTSTGTHR